MDQLGGVDFAKGCYVGQEVVSRMEHRGTARTRAVPSATRARRPRQGLQSLPVIGQLGTMGSAVRGTGLRCCALTAWPTRFRAAKR